MARADYDVAILGAGLAGLSLAVRLVPLTGLRVLLIEPRRAYERDRTWSYWRLHAHPFEAAVAKSWNRWEVMRPVGANVRQAVQASATYPYATIPADRLYSFALDRLSDAPAIELRTGCRVTAVQPGPDRVRVETTDGPVSAGYVFDSRLPEAAPDDYAQRFLGQEVVTDRPCFDPDRVTLMDFAVPQQPGVVRFLYVLPTSRTEALVEDTWLAPVGAALPDHRAGIRTYLAERFGVSAYRVGFEEEGAIPMNARLGADPGEGGRVIPIGTAGGAVKPSSGYGFLATQRMCDVLAADLAAGRRPKRVQSRGPVLGWMDAILLEALRRQPEQAPRIFGSLFERCSPEPLVRFMNDLGTPADAARVLAAMPKVPMLAAAASYTFGSRW